MNFYNWFLIIFLLWIIGKAWSRRQHLREQRSITKALYAIAKKLDIPEKEYRVDNAKQGKLL